VAPAFAIINDERDDYRELVNGDDKQCFILKRGSSFVVPGLRQPTGLLGLGLCRFIGAII